MPKNLQTQEQGKGTAAYIKAWNMNVLRVCRMNKAGATLPTGKQGQPLRPTASKDLTHSMLPQDVDPQSPPAELHTDLINVIALLNSYKGIIRNSTDLIFVWGACEWFIQVYQYLAFIIKHYIIPTVNTDSGEGARQGGRLPHRLQSSFLQGEGAHKDRSNSHHFQKERFVFRAKSELPWGSSDFQLLFEAFYYKLLLVYLHHYQHFFPELLTRQHHLHV